MHGAIEGDNACILTSSTPDLAADTANAVHSRVLRVLFDAAAVDLGMSYTSLSPTSAGATVPLFRITLSYVDVCMEHLFDMLALTK